MPNFLISLINFLRFLWQQLQAKQWRQSAAALTYTSLFALVPVMTVSYVLLSFMPQLKSVQGKIESWVFSHFLPDTGNQVTDYLQQFSSQAKNLTLPGIVILFVTALMMLKTIENAFNTIWDVKQGRRGVASFLLYWAVLSLGPVLAGSALIFSTYLLSLNVFAQVEQLTVVQQSLSFLPLALSCAALCLVYCAVPNCHVPFKHALAGAVFTAILFGVIKDLFALGMKHSSYTLVYGAFAAVPLFLMWIYLCWMTVLFGAVLVRSLSTFPNSEATGHRDIMLALIILNAFWRAQQQGVALKPTALLRGEMTDSNPIGLAPWERLRDILLRHQFIKSTNDGCFILSRDLHNVSLWQIQQLFYPEALQLTGDALTSNGQSTEWYLKAADMIHQSHEQQQQTLAISLAELFDASISATQ